MQARPASVRAGVLSLPDPAHRVSRSAVWHWMTRYAVVALALAAVSLTLAFLVPLAHTARVATLVVITAGSMLAVALTVAVPLWRYAVHRWEVTESVVITRSGAVFRDWRIVPLHRVQTVEVSQGILERAFGVARLVIRTASYSGSTQIAGLDATVAREVADGLTAALIGSTDDGA